MSKAKLTQNSIIHEKIFQLLIKETEETFEIKSRVNDEAILQFLQSYIGALNILKMSLRANRVTIDDKVKEV